MKGQVNNESEKLGKRSEWLERGVWFAGGLVVAGLLMEYGPEIGLASAKHELPRPATVGGLLVTIGVAAEVILGIFVAKTAKRLQVIAETTIAEVRERAANAERAAAEADLARVRLERWIVRRDMSDDERNTIASKLSKFAGQRIIIGAFPVAHEPIVFAGLIAAMLSQARWKVHLPPPQLGASSPDGVMCSGFSMMSTPDEKSLAAGLALVKELGPLSGGGVGPVPALANPEDPRLQLVVHERDAPPKTWA